MKERDLQQWTEAKKKKKGSKQAVLSLYMEAACCSFQHSWLSQQKERCCMSKRKFRYANQSSGQKQEKVHLTQEAMDKLASISQAAGIEDGVGFVFRDKRVGIEGEIIVSKKAFSFLGEEICKGLAKDAIGNMVNEYGQVSNWPEVKPMHYADIRTIVTYCNSVKSNFPYDFLSEHTFTFHLEDEKPKLSQEATDKITDCIRKMIEEQKGKVA